MALWTTTDIGRVLIGLQQVALQSGKDGEYQRGFEAALTSTALAMGVDLGLHAMDRAELGRLKSQALGELTVPENDDAASNELQENRPRHEGG